jgi:hypothetical protein
MEEEGGSEGLRFFCGGCCGEGCGSDWKSCVCSAFVGVMEVVVEEGGGGVKGCVSSEEVVVVVVV